MVRKITPLKDGIHLVIARIDKNFGTAAAVVPANSKGITCPVPKHVSSTTPVAGLPLSAIQVRRTAKTGVVHGEAAKPNVRPAAIGANGFGTFPNQVSNSGALGSWSFKSPNKLRPIKIVIKGTIIPISEGNCP